MLVGKGSSLLIVSLLLCRLTVVSAPLEGATFVVHTVLDFPDLAPGDGECRVNPTDQALCSLRAAVQEANSTPGEDVILLPSGSFLLYREGSGEDLAATGDLDLSDSVIVQGAGAGQTIVGSILVGADRIFDLAPLGGAPAIEIRDLTIRDGYAAAGHGIRNGGATLLLERVVLLENGGELAGVGGALANLSGSATLSQVRIEDNQNVCPPSTLCLGSSAGGIYNEGLLTVRESFIGNNVGHHAGGLANEVTGIVAIENSTFSGNTSSSGPGAIANGFGLSLIHVTLAENDGSSAHDLFTSAGAVSSVRGSVLTSGSFGVKCSGSGAVLSGGFNLENGTSCGFDAPTDLVATSPQLLALAENGGPTPTYRLHPDSPAIDAAGLCTGISGAELARDQRGSRRPVDGDGDGVAYCDIGAYEWLPSAIFADGFETGDPSAWSQTVP